MIYTGGGKYCYNLPHIDSIETLLTVTHGLYVLGTYSQIWDINLLVPNKYISQTPLQLIEGHMTSGGQ